MLVSQLDDAKRLAGWTGRETTHLTTVGHAVAGKLDGLVEAVACGPDFGLTADAPVDAFALRAWVRDWLTALFRGPYDQAYFDRWCGLDRWPTASALALRSRLRETVARTIPTSGDNAVHEALAAFNRVLDLEVLALGMAAQPSVPATRETEQLAAIGQLAASLAHEIKNPLAGIAGAIQIIGQSMKATDPHRDIIEEILKQIHRLDGAVQDLLIYARPKPPKLTLCRVAPSVLATVNLLRQEPALKKVTVSFDGPADGPEAWLDEHQLQQVVTNVVLNAAQACEGGGRVEITVKSDPQRARLTFRDTGRGMAPDVAARAFEPFFTTKARGTGLGLPICRKIVEAHGGRMELTSKLAEGTTVVIEFPLRLKPPHAKEPGGGTR